MAVSQREENPTVEFFFTPEGYFFECHSRKVGPFSESERERADFVFKVAEELGVKPKRVLAALIRISRGGSQTVAEVKFIEDHCGDCLLFKTPKCSYAHVHNLIFKDDVACCEFYPLKARLAAQPKESRREFESRLEAL